MDILQLNMHNQRILFARKNVISFISEVIVHFSYFWNFRVFSG
jgi:hypothetical protein